MKARTVMAGVLAGALAGLSVSAGSAVAAPAQTAAAPSAADRFAACVSANGQANIVLLIDESGSLAGSATSKGSDPDGARVTAAGYLLRSLSNLVDATDAKISVLLSGFANDYYPGSAWLPLGKSGLGGALAQLQSFKDKDNGSGTDYYLALDGARRDLNKQHAKSPNACQAIVFFSDGKLDVEKDSSENSYSQISRPYANPDPMKSGNWAAASTQAASAICSPKGLATQIRSRGIIVFGIGLAVTASASDFSLMQNVVTGSGGCGGLTTPTPGMFTPVQNIDEMLFAFNAVTGGQEQSTKVCQDNVAACAAQDGFVNAIMLDGSVSRVNILGTAPVDGVQVWIVDPQGKQAQLKTSADAGLNSSVSLAAGGMTGTYTWLSAHTVSLQWAKASGANWNGEWKLIFVDPSGKSAGQMAKTSLQVFGDVEASAVIGDTTQLRQDSPIQVTLALKNGAGEKLNPSTDLAGSLGVDVDLVDSAGTTIPVKDGITKADVSAPISIDAQKAATGDGKIQVTLRYTTAAPHGLVGTTLEPSVTQTDVAILPPANFPSVTSTLDFGAIEGAVDVTGDVAVTGPGCVWVDPSTASVDAAPDEAGDVTIGSPNTSQSGCVSVPEGKTANLPVRLTTANSGNGDVTGTFDVKMAPLDEPTNVRQATVAFTAELSRPLNTTNFVVVLVASLILGVGIPVGLAYLAKFLLNSKMPSAGVYVVSCQVSAGAGEVLRDGKPFAVASEELKDMLKLRAGGTRDVTAGAYRLVSHMGASPFGTADVRVVGASAGASSYRTKAGPAAILPLAVANNWALLKNPGMPQGTADLLLLVSVFSGAQERDALVAAVNAKGPQMIAALDDLMPSSGTGTDPQQQSVDFLDFGSAAPGATQPPIADDDPFTHN